LSLPQFRLLRPRAIDEAIAGLAKNAGNIRVLAGGTDLIPSMRQKLFEPEFVLDLRGIAELRGVRPQADGTVEIGVLTTLSAIEKSAHLRQHFSVLTEAAATVASPVLRNMGTIGGNI
jgi:CO/xanthine dehydrogenase FAD-binding subunit